MRTLTFILSALLVGCGNQPHPSDEAFKAMAASCKERGLIMHYYNNGTTVTLTCQTPQGR